MPSLFISYRRSDSPDTVKLLYERLKQRLPRWDIFYDHESIPLGEQFPELLRAKVASATVVLVIIGPKWLQILQERKNAAVDHVRTEVRLALEAAKSVVPILVGHAVIPNDADLAEFPDLQPLLQRNCQPVRPDPDFDADLEPILDHVKHLDSDEAIGASLADKYTLTAEIGRGGMGVVYRAEQKKPVKRTVAVKLIKPGMDSRDVLARFDAERQALAVMDHPNIAKVHDAGMTAGGRPFFVMEFVKGVPITDYCDEKKLTPQERLKLFISVCNAVQHAHQKGIIHRDLKPSNVLVEVVDGKPVAKVIDFGLAKALGQKLTDKTLYTALETRVGTLEYSAPEQAAGRSFDVNTRSDIYSLGVLLYELLTGVPPFTREQLLKIGEEEMRRVIREDEPAKPSKKLSSSGELPAIAANRHLQPNKLTRLVQGDLDWIVMKCLEKENARRYETANQLGEELQRFLADEPVMAGPPSLGYRLQKFVHRRRGWIVGGAALVLFQAFLASVLLVVFGSSPNSTRTPRGDAAIQNLPQRDAGTDILQGKGDIPVEKEPPNSPVIRRRALLIGCGAYPNLKAAFQLRGPANDLRLMKKLLTTKFQISEDDLVCLGDAEPSVSRKPTRANIEREVRRLGDLAEPSDQCVIYFSGGGIQMKILENTTPGAKRSGVEAVFLPRDTKQQLRPDDPLPSEVIRSEDFALWIKPLMAKRSSLWVIYDVCHGGFGNAGESSHAVFTYAARPDEQTSELRMPPGTPSTGQNWHGLFTYTLCQVVNNSQDPITYAELMRRIKSQYASWGRYGPKPWLTGSIRHNLILGDKPVEPRSTILIVPHAQGGHMLNAGSLQGLSFGMILAVKPPFGQSIKEKSLGYVRIKKLQDSFSMVEPCEFSQQAAPKKLPVGSQAEPAYVPFTKMRVKVGVEKTTNEGDALLTKEVQNLAKQNPSEVEWASDPSNADWLLRWDDSKREAVCLENRLSDQNHRGLAISEARHVAETVGPIPANRMSAKLTEILSNMARAKNLFAMIDLLERQQQPVETGIELDLRAGSADGWCKISNVNPFPISVNVLVVGDGYDIISPAKAGPLWLGPNQATKVEIGKVAKARHVFAIACEAKGPSVDFAFLAQPTRELARKRVAPETASLTIDSPMGRLLSQLRYGDGNVHGVEIRMTQHYVLHRVAVWR